MRDYPDPVAPRRAVLADLMALVERLLPRRPTSPTRWTATRAEHAAYAASRFAGYVDRPALARRLDAYATVTRPPLVVTGESGAGASALVANWARRGAERIRTTS